MNKKVLWVILVPCIMVSAACSSKITDCKKRQTLEQFRHVTNLEIVRRADRSFSDGDRRLLGVRGVGLYVPSFIGDPGNYRFGIKVISESSDTPCDSEEALLNHDAVKYSAVYNKEMLKRVGSEAKGKGAQR